MRLATVDEIDLETSGVRGDRRFYLVDDTGSLVNAKRAARASYRTTLPSRTGA